MDEGSGRRRSSVDRRTATRGALAAGAVVLVAAVLAPSLLRTPPPSPAPTGPIAAGSPSAPAETDGPGPSATPDPWSDLALEPFEALAELTAIDPDTLGFAKGSTWSLRSLTGTPAAELAAGLRVDPALDLKIAAGDTPDVAIVRAAAEPTPGIRYRFRLTETDGSLVGTWAFQARAPLQVVGTLPGDRTVGVPPNTGIEVEFDQDGTVDVPSFFSIEPRVAGRFEQHGRVWAFIPEEPLAEAAIYTVTVRAGVAVEGSSEELESDVTFRFETGLPSDREPVMRFGRDLIEVRPNVEPDIAIVMDEDDDQPRIPDSAFVVAHRLPTFRAVTEAAEILAGRNGWAVASPAAVVDTTGLPRVARVEATVRETDAGYVLQVPVQLGTGFYVLTIDQAGAPAQVLLQVTNLSAYALTASHDTAVWVNDLRTGLPIAGERDRGAGRPPPGRVHVKGRGRGLPPRAGRPLPHRRGPRRPTTPPRARSAWPD